VADAAGEIIFRRRQSGMRQTEKLARPGNRLTTDDTKKMERKKPPRFPGAAWLSFPQTCFSAHGAEELFQCLGLTPLCDENATAKNQTAAIMFLFIRFREVTVAKPRRHVHRPVSPPKKFI